MLTVIKIRILQVAVLAASAASCIGSAYASSQNAASSAAPSVEPYYVLIMQGSTVPKVTVDTSSQRVHLLHTRQTGEQLSPAASVIPARANGVERLEILDTTDSRPSANRPKIAWPYTFRSISY